jgi:hypothetical protein
VTPGRPRVQAWPQLSPARLGLALVAITGAAWVTALPYLLVRLGFGFALPLARVDGPHVFIGAALALLLLAKTLELHLGGLLGRLQGVLRWHRWLSLGLLATYGGVLLSGLLLLLPLPGGVQRQLVNLHLLTAAWAAVVTAVHAGRYLLRRLPPGIADLRFRAAVGLIVLPGVALVLAPAAVSPLAQLGAGAGWRPVGPAGTFTSRVMRLDGGRLVAIGTGVWTSDDLGASWSAVPGVADRLVRALAVTPGGGPVYLGTDAGVLEAAAVGGPYHQVGPDGLMETVLVDPADSQRVWAGGRGLWESPDGGATWVPAVAGLVPKGYIWTLGRFGGTLYAGGSTGIYAWTGYEWQQVSAMAGVYSLDTGPGGEIWASSMGQGLAVLRDGRWQPASTGLSPHGHGSRAVHVDGYTWLGGGRAVAATMDSGVAISNDGGANWTELTPGWQPGDVWQVLPTSDGLLAATDTGLYAYRFPAAPSAPAGWWLLLGAGVLTATAAAAALGLTAGGRQAALSRPVVETAA